MIFSNESNEDMAQKLLVALLFSSLAACGMQGDLYLPDEKKTKVFIHGENSRINQQILKVV